jgi:hypothetical protein
MTEKTQRQPVLGEAIQDRIRFVERVGDGQTTVMEFVDPAPASAVLASAESAAIPSDRDGMEILAIPGQPNDDSSALNEMIRWVNEVHRPDAPAPLTITLHGTQVVWRSGRVAILAASERLDSLRSALVEFGYYEKQLGELERIVAEAWSQLEADTPLAFEVTSRDEARRESVARQTQRMLNVRMRHARIGPHLHRPGSHLSSLAIQLGERLREKTRIEERFEALDCQLEAFEQVYEMTSLRFGEFTASRRETTLEWVIIVLLSAEVILLLTEVLLQLER